jgi:hypothetical protein
MNWPLRLSSVVGVTWTKHTVAVCCETNSCERYVRPYREGSLVRGRVSPCSPCLLVVYSAVLGDASCVKTTMHPTRSKEVNFDVVAHW